MTYPLISLRNCRRSSSGASDIAAKSCGLVGKTLTRKSSNARSTRSICSIVTRIRFTSPLIVQPPKHPLAVHRESFGKTRGIHLVRRTLQGQERPPPYRRRATCRDTRLYSFGRNVAPRIAGSMIRIQSKSLGSATRETKLPASTMRFTIPLALASTNSCSRRSNNRTLRSERSNRANRVRHSSTVARWMPTGRRPNSLNSGITANSIDRQYCSCSCTEGTKLN